MVGEATEAESRECGKVVRKGIVCNFQYLRLIERLSSKYENRPKNDLLGMLSKLRSRSEFRIEARCMRGSF